MIGDQKFTSVMDILLNDEVYFALYNLIVRYNNFSIKTITAETENLNNMVIRREHMVVDIWGDFLKIGVRVHPEINSIIERAIHLGTNVSTHPENSIDASTIIIKGSAIATDISPLRKATIDKKLYSDNGWYLRDNEVTDEAEAELFQMSTMHDVYSTYEIQEVMNRARNIPLNQNQCLTIDISAMYHHSYKHMNDILRGY